MTDLAGVELPLFGGARFGGGVFVHCVLLDPIRPGILEEYFDHWNLSARACLLSSYAQTEVESTDPDPYRGIPESIRPKWEAWNREVRARIRQIVEAGEYEAEWRAFVPAYRQVLNAAEAALPAGDTPPERQAQDAERIDRIARENGLHDLVRTIRIEPEDVASEMIRAIRRAREEHGLSDDPDANPGLLYVCFSDAPETIEDASSPADDVPAAAPLNVRVRSWHPLAPSFFAAWSASESAEPGSDGARIRTIVRTLSDRIGTWARAHPEAPATEVEAKLNRMAVEQGLIAMLEEFRPADGRSPSSVISEAPR